jgi:hypothetical protein
VGAGNFTREEWRPQGELVGWVDGKDLYLEPTAALAVAQVLARDGGEPLGVNLPTLKQRLKDKSLLLSWDDARQVHTVRRVFSSKRRNVLHIHADALTPHMSDKPDHPDHPDQDPETGAEWSGPGSGVADEGQPARPPETEEEPEVA